MSIQVELSKISTLLEKYEELKEKDFELAKKIAELQKTKSEMLKKYKSKHPEYRKFYRKFRKEIENLLKQKGRVINELINVKQQILNFVDKWLHENTPKIHSLLHLERVPDTELNVVDHAELSAMLATDFVITPQDLDELPNKYKSFIVIKLYYRPPDAEVLKLRDLAQLTKRPVVMLVDNRRPHKVEPQYLGALYIWYVTHPE